MGMTEDLDFPPSLVPAAIVLAPLLAAPMLLSGSHLAQRGQAWAAHATHIGVAQLNLCALLPLSAILWRARWHAVLVYPLANWRLDAVVLILLAAVILPAAAGRWRPQRIEGLFQILLYIVYVLAVITLAAE
jgi:Ca2+/Na+ antiporter